VTAITFWSFPRPILRKAKRSYGGATRRLGMVPMDDAGKGREARSYGAPSEPFSQRSAS
jgi:hypothetical protein